MPSLNPTSNSKTNLIHSLNSPNPKKSLCLRYQKTRIKRKTTYKPRKSFMSSPFDKISGLYARPKEKYLLPDKINGFSSSATVFFWCTVERILKTKRFWMTFMFWTYKLWHGKSCFRSKVLFLHNKTLWQNFQRQR